MSKHTSAPAPAAPAGRLGPTKNRQVGFAVDPSTAGAAKQPVVETAPSLLSAFGREALAGRANSSELRVKVTTPDYEDAPRQLTVKRRGRRS